MRGRVSPRTSLKVVFTSCSGCFQSQNARVKNADAPPRLWNVANVEMLPVVNVANDQCSGRACRGRMGSRHLGGGRRWNAVPTAAPHGRAAVPSAAATERGPPVRLAGDGSPHRGGSPYRIVKTRPPLESSTMVLSRTRPQTFSSTSPSMTTGQRERLCFTCASVTVTGNTRPLRGVSSTPST